MVKALTFKGDKKVKKRKRAEAGEGSADIGDRTSRAAAAEAEVENDDSWVSADSVTDIAGPVMFVLPTSPPTALTCDAIGKVFTLPIENIVDGNPSSAEPHDVRQVWVASKVAGTGNFHFKGHHSKYLNCDKYGLFSAASEAISPLESFKVTATEESPGTFQVQTFSDRYLSAKESSKPNSAPEVRGDSVESSLETTLRIRMQARFKPQLQANKEEKAKEKISRRELEAAVGRRLEDDEVKRLKKARREGDYYELLLDIKVKDKHDKYS